jgi:hypothetical protein
MQKEISTTHSVDFTGLWYLHLQDLVLEVSVETGASMKNDRRLSKLHAGVVINC